MCIYIYTLLLLALSLFSRCRAPGRRWRHTCVNPKPLTVILFVLYFFLLYDSSFCVASCYYSLLFGAGDVPVDGFRTLAINRLAVTLK